MATYLGLEVDVEIVFRVLLNRVAGHDKAEQSARDKARKGKEEGQWSDGAHLLILRKR